jgi:chemotaxis protein MotB
MRQRRRREGHVNHERWLVSYADFVTLLFALFVVLFASSYRDKQAIESVSKAVKNGFQSMSAFSSSDSAADNARISGPTSIGEAKPSTVPANAGIDIVELQRKLKKALGKEIERQEVALRMTPEGFVISLHELGFFSSGQAQLMPGASEKIKRIAGVLLEYGLDMRVEGHTDNIPIHNAAFASNWDLSTARAMAVAKMLMEEAGVDPQRLSIAGYGEYHPASPNDTEEGRRANRRVDIVVISANSAAKAQPKNPDPSTQAPAVPAPAILAKPSAQHP